MTRKHFEAIAAILARYHIGDPAAGFDEGYTSAADGITSDIADYLETTNERFDRDRFIAAARK